MYTRPPPTTAATSLTPKILPTASNLSELQKRTGNGPELSSGAIGGLASIATVAIISVLAVSAYWFLTRHKRRLPAGPQVYDAVSEDASPGAATNKTTPTEDASRAEATLSTIPELSSEQQNAAALTPHWDYTAGSAAPISGSPRHISPVEMPADVPLDRGGGTTQVAELGDNQKRPGPAELPATAASPTRSLEPMSPGRMMIRGHVAELEDSDQKLFTVRKI